MTYAQEEATGMTKPGSLERTIGLYRELGVKRVINARGHQTLLGGSRLAPRVLQAMAAANESFVDMEELLQRSGEIIAELIGAEAAFVTPGCAAALALATAACMTGDDAEKAARLPDVAGMPHEILIQRAHRYKYARCVTIFGGRLVEVGDEAGTTVEQLDAAIGPQTAAILYWAPSGKPGALPIEDVLRIGKRRNVPLIVDAAAQVYPPENLRQYVGMGADLVCYGAKYFGAPNSTGILCGRRELVQAAAMQGFIGFEVGGGRAVGRPLKVDRQEVVAVVVALREWLSMDHQARLDGYDRKVRFLLSALGGIDGVTVVPVPAEGGPATAARIAVDAAVAGMTAADVAAALCQGDPAIYVYGDAESLAVTMATVADGEEQVIGERLRSILSQRPAKRDAA
jgi:L-seryl-tRNA(Ser) seleniumtransferase